MSAPACLLPSSAAGKKWLGAKAKLRPLAPANTVSFSLCAGQFNCAVT
tara:strand:- start:21144 stop:21287 length:144 start_codon:yes stop_codon:yes gene_type:complete